jgi:hypothetical protein
MKINFLQDNEGNFSSMRLSLMIICIVSALLGLAMVTSIIIKSFSGVIIDWSGMGIFLGSLGIFIGIAITGKIIQKRDED